MLLAICVLLYVYIISYGSCHVQSVPVTNLRFLYDGRRLGDSETPKEVRLLDNYLFHHKLLFESHRGHSGEASVFFHQGCNADLGHMVLASAD